MRAVARIALLMFVGGMSSGLVWAVDPVQKGSMQLSLEVADPGGTETVTDTATLVNIKASEIEPFIRARLSRYGAVQVNDAMNMLLITDMPRKVADLVKTAKKLDSPDMKDFLRLETAIIPVKNTQAIKLVNLIREKLSPDAVIKTDDNLNTLLITDVKSKIDLVKLLIAQLDLPVRQVMIEVKILELQNGNDSQIGVDWRQVLHAAQISISSKKDISDENDKSTNLSRYDNNAGSNSYYSAAPKQTSENTFDKTQWAGSLQAGISVNGLDRILGIIISDGKGKVLSSPRIVGSNNQTAQITDGDQIYYYDKNANAQSVNAGISLSVTPHIVTDDMITLDLNAHINNLTGWGPTGAPIVSSRSANSTVTIKNGELFVMGGLKKNSLVKQNDRVPILGYIPILDYFFSSQKETSIANDVVIFIVPTILNKVGENTPGADNDLLQNLEKEMKPKE